MGRFITDMGHPLVVKDQESGDGRDIGRYGVWERGDVIDCGSNLEALQDKYGPGLDVIVIAGRKA